MSNAPGSSIMPRMNRHWPLHAIAWVTLLLGGVVYFYARPDSLFASGQALYTPLTGQLPSFLHTLAFALACALVPARLPAALAAILAWGLVELLAELAQHDRVSLAAPLEPYQLASTFDPMDLVAITLAILVALGLTLALRSTPEASPQ